MFFFKSSFLVFCFFKSYFYLLGKYWNFDFTSNKGSSFFCIISKVSLHMFFFHDSVAMRAEGIAGAMKDQDMTVGETMAGDMGTTETDMMTDLGIEMIGINIIV